jgi:carboxypeptidase Q
LLTATNYYDVEVQPFTVPSSSATLSVGSVEYEVAPMTFTAAGSPEGEIVVVSNLGCNAVSRYQVFKLREQFEISNLGS